MRSSEAEKVSITRRSSSTFALIRNLYISVSFSRLRHPGLPALILHDGEAMSQREQPAFLNFHIPDMEEAAQMNKKKKEKLKKNLESVISELVSLTERVAGRKEGSSSAEPLSKTDEPKALLEALGLELTTQLRILGDNAKLHTDEEKWKFEESRENIMKAWTEYQKVWGSIVRPHAGPSK